MKYTKNMYLFFVDCIKVEQVSEEEQEKTGRTTGALCQTAGFKLYLMSVLFKDNHREKTPPNETPALT